MAEAGQPSVKRVISTHEDFQGDEKKSKTGEDITNQGTADPAVAATAARQQEMTPPSPPAMVEEVDEDEDDGGEDARPVATIFHADTGSSNTTQSSLSDENCSSPALAPDGGGVNLNKITKIPRNISHGSGTVNSSLGNKQSSVGNWGWFEEVANGEGRGDSLRGGFLPGGPGIKDGGKRRGLLDFGTEIMSSIIPGLGADRREANTMAVTAPTYVLEESLSSQKLWKQTAGNRPPQPVEERHFFEQMWAQNFTRSKVKYEIPVEVLTASTPISISPFNDDGFCDDDRDAPGNNLSNYNLAAPFGMKDDGPADSAYVKAAQADVAEATLNQHLSNGAVEMYFDPNRPKDYNLNNLGPHNHQHHLVNKKVKGAGEESDLTVLVRGDNVFGTTVSKSFPRTDLAGEPIDGMDTVSISIASYRVVESKKHGKYAQYLVIFCDGNFRNTVGVWKRYSDFSQLSRKVTQGHHESCAAAINPLNVTEDRDVEILPNAITSWRLLKKRQRWYRCLDAGYLSLKVFLLERFLHDILFESSNPQILRDFVGVISSEGSLNRMGSVKA